MSLKINRLKIAFEETLKKIRGWESDRKKILLSALNKTASRIKNIVSKRIEGFRALNSILSSSRYLLPEFVIYITVAFLFSVYSSAMSSIHFHLISVSGNNQMGIQLALIILFSITIGWILNYILKKIRILSIIILSSSFLVFSILLSYFSIINFEGIPFQYLLVIPYSIVSLALFTIISRTKSKLLFFITIAAGSAGAIVPLLLFSHIKTENLLFLLAFFPMIVLLLNCFRIKNIPAKIVSLSLCAGIIIRIFLLILINISGPPVLSSEIFENKIMAELDKNLERRNFYKNIPLEFVHRSYYYNSEKDSYILNDLDEYDYERLNYILEVVGARKRWNIGSLPFLKQQPAVSDISTIEADLFEFELIPLIQDRFSLKFFRNYDLLFLNRVYSKKSDGNYYFTGNVFDAKRVNYLFTQLGHLKIYDLYFDLRFNYKVISERTNKSNADRLLYSSDSIYGRIELTGQFSGGIDDIDELSDTFYLNINNIPIDSIDAFDGSSRDPRVPWKDGNPEMLIIGPSIDNILKSVKKLQGSRVDVVDLHPEMEKLVAMDNPFSYFANYPYESVDIIKENSQCYLQTINGKYDEILLMNIQKDKQPFSLYKPLYYHSKEGLMLLLDAINEHGYVVFKEIVDSPRDQAAFLKLINTIQSAMTDYGVQRIEECFFVYKWGTTRQDDIFRTIIIKKNSFNEEEKELLDDYFSTIEESPYTRKVQKLYDPYTMISDTYLGRYIGGEIFNEFILPEKMTSYDFSVLLISKLDNSFEINYLLNKYQFNPAQDSYFLLVKNLTQSDIYQLKSIFRKTGFMPSYNLSPVTSDNPYPYNVYEDEFKYDSLLVFLAVLALLLFIPLVLITVNKAGKYKRKIIPYGLFAIVTSTWNICIFFFFYFIFQKYFYIETVPYILIISGIFLLGGTGGFLADIMNRKAFFASIAALPFYLLFLMYKIDNIFMLLNDKSIELNFLVAYLIIMPVILITGIILRYTYNRMAGKSSRKFMIILSAFKTAVSLLISVVFFRFLLTAGFNNVFLFLIIFSALLYLGFIVYRKKLN